MESNTTSGSPPKKHREKVLKATVRISREFYHALLTWYLVLKLGFTKTVPASLRAHAVLNFKLQNATENLQANYFQ